VCVEPAANGPGSEAHQETLEGHDIRQFDHEDPLGLQRLPNNGEESERLASVFEDVDAEDDVVLRALELDLLEIHDAVLVGIGATPSLGLQHVDADDVDRLPDLEVLVSGFDVQHPQDPVTREDRVDESLRFSAFRLGRLDLGFVFQVTHGAPETTSERLGMEQRGPVLSVGVGVSDTHLASRHRRSAHPLWKEVSMTTTDMWTYGNTSMTAQDLTGFTVEALDGDIGKIDEATNEVGGSYIVVDTGPWIFGKKVLLPAGVLRDADFDDEKVFVNRTKDQIKNAPEFDEDRYRDDGYRTQVGGYYGPGGAGYRDEDMR
jgi:hypothetical protein